MKYEKHKVVGGTIFRGDSLDVMKAMPDNSIDNCITDPPYGLSKEPDIAEVLTRWLAGDKYEHGGSGFMGKSWDSFVPGPEYWKELYRILKPGGFLLVFAGTRTWDLMGIALRVGGFQIKDCIMWHHASGFPKSLSIDKAIDKIANRKDRSIIELKTVLIDLFNKSGKTRKQIDEECGFRACNYLTLPAAGKRPDPWIHILPTREKWQKIKEVLGVSDVLIEKCDTEIEEIELDKLFEAAEREIIGTQTKARSENSSFAIPAEGSNTKYETWDITVPATDEAKLWSGYGTALKPAWEPIIIAQKPIDKTYANNVLKHGVGGLNINACRIPTKSEEIIEQSGETDYCDSHEGYKRPGNSMYNTKPKERSGPSNPSGRFPANLILSHSSGCKRKKSDETGVKEGECQPDCPIQLLNE